MVLFLSITYGSKQGERGAKVSGNVYTCVRRVHNGGHEAIRFKNGSKKDAVNRYSSMIRLLLYSRDPKLHASIAAGLSVSFTIGIDSSRNRAKELVSQQRFDVVLFDFDGSYAPEQFT